MHKVGLQCFITHINRKYTYVYGQYYCITFGIDSFCNHLTNMHKVGLQCFITHINRKYTYVCGQYYCITFGIDSFRNHLTKMHKVGLQFFILIGNSIDSITSSSSD